MQHPRAIAIAGVHIPPRRVKHFLHVSACLLLVADCVFGLALAYYLPHPVLGVVGNGAKIGAALESLSMFIEEHI